MFPINFSNQINHLSRKTAKNRMVSFIFDIHYKTIPHFDFF